MNTNRRTEPDAVPWEAATDAAFLDCDQDREPGGLTISEFYGDPTQPWRIEQPPLPFTEEDWADG